MVCFARLIIVCYVQKCVQNGVRRPVKFNLRKKNFFSHSNKDQFEEYSVFSSSNIVYTLIRFVFLEKSGRKNQTNNLRHYGAF